MGMKASGDVFQRLFDLILGELQPLVVVAHIDNVPIFSPSISQQLIDLGAVLRRLKTVDLKLNLEK